MKVQKMPNYDATPPHERSLNRIIDSMREDPPIQTSGLEKTSTIRFNDQTYPRIKAIANLSGNSLNSIVNELVQVAIGVVISNMGDEEVKRFNKESVAVLDEWVEDVNKNGLGE